MQLDPIQIAEFDQHWHESYLLYKDRLVYVYGAAAGKRTVNVSYVEKNNDRTFAVSYQDLEVFNPETGLYNWKDSKTPMMFFFSRIPKRQVRRGVGAHNSRVDYPAHPKMKGDFDWKRSGNLHNYVESLVNPYYDYPVEALRKLMESRPDKSLVLLDYDDRGQQQPIKSIRPSCALSPEIGAYKSKYGYIILTYRTTIIAYYVDGAVFLDKTKQCFKELLQELRIGAIK